MDAYAYFGALETAAFKAPETKCGVCEQPWDGFATDADGVDLCEPCHEESA